MVVKLFKTNVYYLAMSYIFHIFVHTYDVMQCHNFTHNIICTLEKSSPLKLFVIFLSNRVEF